MNSVTGRIKEITQPRGGYLKIKDFQVTELKDNIDLNEKENINASIVGLVVDYLSRVEMGDEPQEAFKISLLGANKINEISKANRLLRDINGNDDKSIISACKLAGYDVCFRASVTSFKNPDTIIPDRDTIENIKIMVERMKYFIKTYGPIVDNGMTFPGGYTTTVSSGDADFMTKDTLWDLKVSVSKPISKHTLQILMYYILGMHSNKEKYSKIKKLGFFNPRLNTVYLIDINSIDVNIIKEVEDEVICYGKNDIIISDNFKDNNSIKANQEIFKDNLIDNSCNMTYTVTDLMNRYHCSRYKIMKMYSEYGLPLRKEKNKYIVDMIELNLWEENRRKSQKKIALFYIIVVLIMIIFLCMLLKYLLVETRII